MATTTNYGWTTPDNTDLVKDGASAIRTLGSSIDTTLKAQIDAQIPDAVLTTTGDVIYASGVSTPARLGIGSTGQVLGVASGLPSWTTPSTVSNKIINGNFGVWQRGTSFTLTTGSQSFTADRFRALCNFSAGTSTASQQTFTPGTAPVAGYEGTFFHRISCGSTATYAEMSQMIEDVRVFAGETVTLSFWAKASSSFTTGTLLAQNFGSGGSSEVTTAGASVTIGTSWTRFSVTIAVPSIAGKTIGTSSYLRVYPLTATATLNGVTIDYWGVQIQAGSLATPFQTATGTVQGELAACQRYYFRFRAEDGNGLPMMGQGAANSGNACDVLTFVPVTLRKYPSSVDYSSLIIQDYGGSTIGTVSSASVSGAGSNTFPVTNVVMTSSVLTAGKIYRLLSGSSSGYLGINAEL
jgi:hypothetical protein